MMKRQRRQQAIVERLRAGDVQGIGELAEGLGVSEETVRRELRVLEDAGTIVRSHGGARLAQIESEGSFALRLQRNAAAKQRIAAAVAEQVVEGQTIFIDASTTGHYVARALREHRRLTVLTNAVGVATELGGRNDNRVVLAGGELDYDYLACFDASALAHLALFTPALAIMSVESVHRDHGFTDYHIGEAAVCRLLVARSRRVLMAVDATKFDRYGTVTVAGFDAVDVLVTDVPPPADYADVLAAMEVAVG